jgi:hypothetical protein
MPEQSCRSCRFLRVAPNKAGKRVPRAGNSYCCMYEPQRPLLPDAMTATYGFKWPPTKTFMEPHQGTSCPCYAEIE